MADSQSPIGQTVSHYRIVKKLGGGGMGGVYEAEDTRLHRNVALKFLPDNLAKDHMHERVFRERRRRHRSQNQPQRLMQCLTAFKS